MRSSIYALVVATAVVLGAPSSADASCIPGFDFGAFGDRNVDYGGNTGCDAWNSTAGPYANPPAGSISGRCDLGTNGTSNGALTIHGTASEVVGNLYYGNGGPSSALNVNGNPGYNTSGPLAAPLPLTPVSVPTPGTNPGACSSCTIIPNNTYTSGSGSPL